SLIILIEIEDIYKDQVKRPDIFDLDYSASYDPKTSDNSDSEDPKKKYSI
ncbi:15180_t:CDS:2, partial [Funneliformis mosseae]